MLKKRYITEWSAISKAIIIYKKMNSLKKHNRKEINLRINILGILKGSIHWFLIIIINNFQKGNEEEEFDKFI